MISIYTKQTDNNITLRDEDAIRRYVDLIQWGRKNPVQFIEKIFQIPLMDYQKWLVAMSWNKEYVVWTVSRNGGKSFLAGIIMMAKSLLYPKLKVHIISSGSRQACETFETMETIIRHNVKTLVSDNEVYWSEVEKTRADSDGFVHDNKRGHFLKLANGSFIQAVIGSVKTVRGKRSNFLIFDECGTIPEEMITVCEAFATQSAEFKMGSSYDPEVYPQEAPNCRFYIGSASDTNSAFYAKYREGCKQMLAGNEKYFVADISCEIPMHPTSNGFPLKPLLSKDEVDRKMRENEILANREYYNIFDRLSAEDSVCSRTDIAQNEDNFVPIMKSTGKKRQYLITYDPSSRQDNSVILVTEIYTDKDNIIKGRLVHMENLVHRYGDGSKRPMRLDEQTNRIRELIYNFNDRENNPYYDNVHVLIDNGTGGQPSAIVQELCKDWIDSSGKMHPGIYDDESEDMKRWAEAFPHAIPGHLHLLEPIKYRNQFFEAAKKLVPLGHIRFSPRCPKGTTIALEDGEIRKLSQEELNSLIQMDMMKEELSCIVKFKTPKGNVTYGLPPEYARKMHDDRCYVCVMACYWVNKLQLEETLGEEQGVDYESFLTNKQNNQNAAIIKDDKWRRSAGGHSSNPHKKISPFEGSNPFKRR